MGYNVVPMKTVHMFMGHPGKRAHCFQKYVPLLHFFDCRFFSAMLMEIPPPLLRWGWRQKPLGCVSQNPGQRCRKYLHDEIQLEVRGTPCCCDLLKLLKLDLTVLLTASHSLL